MTRNRRIALNFLATYGRSVFALVCGIFTGRWLLMALGEVDFGLYGLIAGLTALVGFVNSLMSTAVSRYYAFAVGAAQGRRTEGLEDCRRWFNAAVGIHTVLPLLLMAVGYPLGEWAVRQLLTIPAARIVPCLWVWRCVCMTCLVAMMNVPFNAMYVAKQEIAELTLYGVVQTVVNVVVIYYMASHPGDWLSRYAAYAMLCFCVPQAVIMVRALWAFPECRFRLPYLFDWTRYGTLVAFAGWRFCSAFSSLLNQQGLAVLVNKLLGPAFNASVTIGTQLSGQSKSLASALTGALSPAITNACGAGRMNEVRRLCLMACKLSGVFILVFALPLLLESETVLTLWLREPPAEAAEFCICLLGVLVLESMTCGHYLGIFAVGTIARYQVTISLASLVALPLMAAGLWGMHRLLAAGLALVISMVLQVIVRLVRARETFAFSPRLWSRAVFWPLAGASLFSLALGVLPRFLLEAGFLRVVLTTAVTDVPFLALVWRCALTTTERETVLSHVRKGLVGRRLGH